MYRRRMKSFSGTLFLAGIVILGCSFFLTGCSTTPKQLDPSVSAPQVIVNPDSIRLSVAVLTDTDIVFEGSGFEAGDSVFVSLIGSDDTEIAVADGPVRDDGTFKAAAGPLAKVGGILRSTVSGTYAEDGSYEQRVVRTQDPIPAGAYTVQATGMLSGQTAETELLVKKAGFMGSFKDWLGTRLGKIEDKRP